MGNKQGVFTLGFHPTTRPAPEVLVSNARVLMGLVMTNRQGPWGEKLEWLTEEDDENEVQQSANPVPIKKIRMIDWIYAARLTIFTPLWCIVWLVAGKIAITDAPQFAFAIFCLIPLTILATPLILVVNLIGYVFDIAKDTLTYPVFFFRRSIPISQMQDANSATITTERTYDTSSLARAAGDFSPKRPQTVIQRKYVVYVSGDFGARVMRFGARYKRDQFLSIVRGVAPQCRITRYPWY